MTPVSDEIEFISALSRLYHDVAAVVEAWRELEPDSRERLLDSLHPALQPWLFEAVRVHDRFAEVNE